MNMNREILFRGKRIDNGEWIRGSLITDVFYTIKDNESIPYILNSDMAEYDCFEDFGEHNGIYEVDKDTICQYTGLTSKNGKKIFEGDILRHADETILKTVWNDRKYGFAAQCVKGSVLLKDCKWGLWEFESDEVEVIGNVFDNPELLKGEKNGEDI